MLIAFFQIDLHIVAVFAFISIRFYWKYSVCSYIHFNTKLREPGPTSSPNLYRQILIMCL